MLRLVLWVENPPVVFQCFRYLLVFAIMSDQALPRQNSFRSTM
jgi:hypothetical protein